jgi:uncharacterized protein YacL
MGGIALAVVGYGAGRILWPDIQSEMGLEDIQAVTLVRFLISFGFALVGFGIGYLVTPSLLRPLYTMHVELSEVPPAQLTGATIGLGIGLMLAALMALPLSFLPEPFGELLPFILAIVFGYLGAATVGHNPRAYLDLLQNVFGRNASQPRPGDFILLDTSVIIDGRIADVAETNFLDKTLLAPRFVLNELQQVADSPDALRRNRGRRGFEVLNRLQHSSKVSVEITDEDIPNTDDVDRKLVRLAERLNCPSMTNDYNLNQLAEVQGIRVLNLNELANAIKTLLLPGEPLEVRIIQEGKEHGQGVGYLDDGTMVVVEHGRSHLDEMLSVTVTRVLQTNAGRMIFATPTEVLEAQRSEPELVLESKRPRT